MFMKDDIINSFYTVSTGTILKLRKKQIRIAAVFKSVIIVNSMACQNK